MKDIKFCIYFFTRNTSFVFVYIYFFHISLDHISNRGTEVSTNQASWFLTSELHGTTLFFQNCSPSFFQGLRTFQNWVPQKSSMKSLGQKFKFFAEKWVFWCPNIIRTLILWPLKTLMSPQKFNVQNLFCTMITHILMIKKRSLTFSRLEK